MARGACANGKVAVSQDARCLDQLKAIRHVRKALGVQSFAEIIRCPQFVADGFRLGNDRRHASILGAVTADDQPEEDREAHEH